MNVKCPSCNGNLIKSDKRPIVLLNQEKRFPQYLWSLFVCKCGYETVRSNGAKKS